MEPLLIALALVAVAAAAFLAGSYVRSRRHDPPAAIIDQPLLPSEAATLARMTQAVMIFVGPHDEVLDASDPALTLGLTRGSRLTHEELLDLVRETRRTEATVHRDLVLARRGYEKSYLTAVLAALNEDVVAILADDLTSARRIDDARRDFVTNVSHELKTPIGAIAILAEAVQSAADDPAAVARFAERMHVESARLTELVGQIITMSRLQAQDPLHAAGPVSISEVVSEAVDRNVAAARRRHVNLSVADHQPGDVTGDRVQLVDAVANLVANAITYSDEGARVAVAARSRAQDGDPVIEITVSDNGIGIPLDLQEQVFERFYRVDPHRSRASGGTGLGLSIVRLVTEAHGGSVSLWSRVGQGSSFTITLPARVPGPEAPAWAPTADSEETAQ